MAGVVDLKQVLKTTAPTTVLLTDAVYIGVLVLIWILTSHLSSGAAGGGAMWMNRLLALIGALCGWIVGTGLAPYTEVESQKFRAITTAASAFLSGYVVSKLDRFLEMVLFQNSAGNALAWERVGLFIASFLATALLVFINRFYAAEDKPIS